MKDHHQKACKGEISLRFKISLFNLLVYIVLLLCKTYTTELFTITLLQHEVLSLLSGRIPSEYQHNFSPS